MNIERSLFAIALAASTFACGGDDGNRTSDPMFTTANAEGTGMTDPSETGTASGGDGDGDATTGDGDGDATTSTGDGDGEPATGDGDGDATTTTGDGDGDGACEGADPALVGSSCGQGQAYQGSFDIGAMNADLPIGAIDQTDNGIGDGAEDWYQFDFPAGARPNAGTAKISFVANENNDYRFEIYRDCGSPAYGMGLASEFGADAPPLTEWSFHDIQSMEEQVEYIDNTTWPTTVWVRVFRFQNDGECGNYQLMVERTADTP